MSVERVRAAFEARKAEGRAALVTYLTQGDPSPAGSLEVLCAMADAGADVIELGVPFSDPSADGPVIQEAMQRALAAGGGLVSALQTVRDFRARGYEQPIVLFGYYNPIVVYGVERFARDASEAGVDAVLTVDLPLEELAELYEPLRAEGLGVVPLLAPTSTKDRVERVAGFNPAFVYYVSMTGVTGAAFAGATADEARISEIRQASKAPVAVGFGIKTGEDAAKVAAFADGVVVGSALVKRVAASEEGDVSSVAELTKELAAACRQPGS